jgi:peroxiredoxin
MQKRTIAIILLISILLISAGMVAMGLVGNDPLARTGSGSNTLDRLMADMGVRQHHLNTDPLAVELVNTAGRYVRLDDFRGKIVFLNFWTTWCPTCIIEMPSMEKLHRKLMGTSFAVVAVNIKEPAGQVRKFMEKHKLTFMSLLDITGEVSSEFGIGAIPATFILDKDGRIIGRITGSRKWDSRESVAFFELLANK